MANPAAIQLPVSPILLSFGVDLTGMVIAVLQEGRGFG